ncbi:MAG: sialate O-acetylesterase, partial [Bacteroidota bacterium]
GGGGGFTGSPEDLKLLTANVEVPLSGAWHFQIGSFSIDFARNHTPTILYNKMLHPLAGLPLSGVLWYQGESNAGPQDAAAYEEQFKDLITHWRSVFENEHLPFYWVQLANFLAPQASPDEEGWAVLRNSQTAALSLPNTGQAVIIDIGEADDIHPRNKWEVGRRLSLHALKNVYGQNDMTASSPTVVKVEKMGPTARLLIDHAPEGLMTKNDRYGYAKGFVYRNQEQEWKWAMVAIQPVGNSIVVLPQLGDEVTAVRYGWSNNPADANVFSKGGLPLTPFHVELD